MIIALMHQVQRDQWGLSGVMVWVEIRHGHTTHRYFDDNFVGPDIWIYIHLGIDRFVKSSLLMCMRIDAAWKLWMDIIQVCVSINTAWRLHFWSCLQTAKLCMVYYYCIIKNFIRSECVICARIYKNDPSWKMYLLDLSIKVKHFLWKWVRPNAR